MRRKDRLSMRKIKEVLRLKYELGLSNREISRSCSIPHSSVANYLRRARAAAISWPLPESLDEVALEKRLFPEESFRPIAGGDQPDFAGVHQELRQNKHVTLQLLWEEYQQTHPEGYQYSRFCELYRQWSKKLDPTLRQEYHAGEKLFVDFAGDTLPITNPQTGEVTPASLFVAVLGASNYTYAELTPNQQLPHWIGAQRRAFEFIQGITELVIPDNTRTAVQRACRYEPDLNPVYQAFAAHYGVAILPTRPARPRDKAKVENAVLIAERWILAVLRKRTFFSLAEANAAVAELNDQLNRRRFRKLPTSRAELFEKLDRPALKPLPAEPFTYFDWKRARVNIDYHIEIHGHYYSVPYTLLHKEVEVRITASTVEIFFKSQRVASHPRNDARGHHTTCPDHRPPQHQHYLEWTPERILSWAEKTGTATRAVVAHILNSKAHPEQGYRAALGLLRLGKRYSDLRLEKACQRALVLNACSYQSIKSMLEKSLDRHPLPASSNVVPLALKAHHDNVRGAAYYQEKEATHASGTHV
jgi:transposase